MDMIMRLRGHGIYDTRVLSAMEAVPRRYFVPDACYEQAYADMELPIDCGQSLSSPLTIAMMTQVLEVGPDHKVLEIGTGSGYHAAILSRMVTRVYSIERYHRLIGAVESRCRQHNFVNIVLRHGDGLQGWRGQAPFDRIIVTCGLHAAPTDLVDQLTDQGRLVAVVNGRLCEYTADKNAAPGDIVGMTLPLFETGKSKVL
ncbi:MAG: protein-L-isoaspartate(D-aspartate) O-methyltransferase [Hyphomonadaceae bacterium]|nr:protein-L-isoaspartate(D-aspartate) O-methyltransferase [Hyphomonadaceae bacterium]